MMLDEKDRRLVSLLRNDGRMRNRELAQRVGLSPSACLARVRRLEESGVIVGYRAIVAAYGRGGLEGWIDIRLLDPSPDATRELADLIDATAAIMEAHKATGACDYVIRFCADDMHSLNTLKQKLDALGTRMQSRFSLMLSLLK